MTDLAGLDMHTMQLLWVAANMRMSLNTYLNILFIWLGGWGAKKSFLERLAALLLTPVPCCSKRLVVSCRESGSTW